MSINIPPPPEDYKYFVTITLPPTWYHKDAMKQFYDSKIIIKDYISNFFTSAVFIPELTEKANIHWHGVVKFRPDDRHAMIKFFNFSRMSRVDCQPIKNLQHVWEYIHKDLAKTQSIMELNSIYSLIIRRNDNISRLLNDYKK